MPAHEAVYCVRCLFKSKQFGCEVLGIFAGNFPNLGLSFLWKAELPSFPHDFPDCSAYSQFISRQAEEFQETYNRTPPSKRSLHPALPQPWKFKHDERLPGLGGGGIDEGVTHTTVLGVDESDTVMGNPTDAATTSRDSLDLPTFINSPAHTDCLPSNPTDCDELYGSHTLGATEQIGDEKSSPSELVSFSDDILNCSLPYLRDFLRA